VKSNANQDKADKEAIARKAAHSGDDEMVDVEQGMYLFPHDHSNLAYINQLSTLSDLFRPRQN
jgi:hypothetical protein